MKRIIVSALLLSIVLLGCSPPYDYAEVTQLTPPINGRQNMSYLITSNTGELFIIDGGDSIDKELLLEYIDEFGGIVNGWFITHPDSDHAGALTELILDGADFIEHIYYLFPTEDYIREYGYPDLNDSIINIKNTIENCDIDKTEVKSGDIFAFDNLEFSILNGLYPDIHQNAVNNNSIVIKATDNDKSIIFLGDVGYEQADRLVEDISAELLDSDAVTMAHHGQAGGSFTLYEAISPTTCFWPSTHSIIANDGGAGPGSGDFKIDETLEWVNTIGIENHYISYEGVVTLSFGEF